MGKYRYKTVILNRLELGGKSYSSPNKEIKRSFPFNQGVPRSNFQLTVSVHGLV